ncbi:MAG: DUF2520 domain-containing protein, partial [Ignavibacteriales bacterium]|nr:DUF2520 domain-containing protein [Ignavibacteriales bacterium]
PTYLILFHPILIVDDYFFWTYLLLFFSEVNITLLFLFVKLFVKRYTSFELMKPIIETTVRNAGKNGVAKSLSGPIDRGDIETIKQHINALKKFKGNKLLLPNYIYQSLMLLNVAEEKYGKLNPEQVKIKSLLIKQLNLFFHPF